VVCSEILDIFTFALKNLENPLRNEMNEPDRVQLKLNLLFQRLLSNDAGYVMDKGMNLLYSRCKKDF
jgi:hypothetical protein